MESLPAPELPERPKMSFHVGRLAYDRNLVFESVETLLALAEQQADKDKLLSYSYYKAALDNANVQTQMDVKRDEEAYTVQTTQNSDATNTKHDAKEKGRNEYFDIRRKDRKNRQEDGVVRVKKPTSGFDLKI